MSTSTSLRTVALGDLDHEIANTRRMLESVPEEHAGWRPHPKSMTLGGLATHLANLFFWQQMILQQDEFDLASAPPPLSALATREEWLAAFERNAAALRRSLDGIDEAQLMSPWTLRRGEHVIAAQPRVTALRSMGISHVIHHRGQLSVYLRLLEVPVPGTYGPSADEIRGG
jgi:uncharacterized damage-inducible protein DinB